MSLLFFAIPVQADAPIIAPLSSKEEMQHYAVHQAAQAGVRASVVLTVIECETMHTWDPTIQSTYPNARDGGRELSFGLAQIHMPDHPNVTMEEATDARFAINFLVDNLSEGRGAMWSCYRSHYL